MDAWPPMNFKDYSGRPSGLGAEYIQYFNKVLGDRFEIVSGPFKENLEKVKEKSLDALMDVTPKPERAQFLNFTQLYLSCSPYDNRSKEWRIFHPRKGIFPAGTLALEAGFFNVTYFKENFPAVHHQNLSEHPCCPCSGLQNGSGCLCREYGGRPVDY